MSKSERRKIVKKDTAKIGKASKIHDLSDDVLIAVTGGVDVLSYQDENGKTKWKSVTSNDEIIIDNCETAFEAAKGAVGYVTK